MATLRLQVALQLLVCMCHAPLDTFTRKCVHKHKRPNLGQQRLLPTGCALCQAFTRGPHTTLTLTLPQSPQKQPITQHVSTAGSGTQPASEHSQRFLPLKSQHSPLQTHFHASCPHISTQHMVRGCDVIAGCLGPACCCWLREAHRPHHCCCRQGSCTGCLLSPPCVAAG